MINDDDDERGLPPRQKAKELNVHIYIPINVDFTRERKGGVGGSKKSKSNGMNRRAGCEKKSKSNGMNRMP